MFAIFTTPHPVCKGISQSYDWISQQSTSHRCMRHVQQEIKTNRPIQNYRSGTVNSKSFVGKVLLRIKWKFELTYAL